MATNYPTSSDTFANPTPSSPRNSPSLSALISNIGDAVEALQAKVGINSSSDAASLDYILKNKDGGHAHTGAVGDGKAIVWSSVSGKPSTFTPASHAHSSHSGIGANDHHSEVHTNAKHTFSGARMVSSGTATTNNTVAVIDFTSSEFDSGSYADLTLNRFNVPANGYYRIVARATFNSDNSGYRRLRILLDGSSVDVDQRMTVSGDTTSLQASWIGSLTTSNKISADVLQTAGRNLQMSSAAMSIEFLGTA